MANSFGQAGRKVKLLRILPSTPQMYFHCEGCNHLVPYGDMHSNLSKAEQKAIYRERQVMVFGVAALCGPCRNKKYNG